MPHRATPGGYVYHVLNRATPGTRLFETPADYRAFERILAEACQRFQMRILAYCLMPNHWHLVLWPYNDGDLAQFMHWVTTTHARRWRDFHETSGRGHLYQGRFKSIVVKNDEHLVILLRYVERNALRAGLVRLAEQWRWCSLWRRLHPEGTEDVPPLTAWPGDPQNNWLEYVNESQIEEELDAVRRSIMRGVPFGPPKWRERIAKTLGIEARLRPRGRPKKKIPDSLRSPAP